MLAEGQGWLAREANEVLVGLLGIGLTLAVQRLSEVWQNRRLQKKFPVAGTYLTKYQDQGSSHTDMVVLKQAGRKIEGESVPNTERSVKTRKWLFTGEIMTEGYVTGSYKPEAFTDKGFGAFFLRFEKDGDMKGYWIGKDADEKEIVSGEYTFWRQPAFAVASLERSDIPRALRIAEDRLGDAYINAEELVPGNGRIAIGARVNDAVIAFATARIEQTDQFLEKVRDRLGPDEHTLVPLERRLTGEKSIGFVASAATDPDFEGRGIGATLIGQCINELEVFGANVLIATAWKSNKGIQAGSILECRGFQQILELPNYWEKDSLAHGYSCPTCGKPPCRCTAILYARGRSVTPKKRR
jgi:ribosomal protein S18 acetylase RimI-like enzyme